MDGNEHSAELLPDTSAALFVPSNDTCPKFPDQNTHLVALGVLLPSEVEPGASQWELTWC